MTRLWCALIVVAVCAGCRNSPPVADPFLGTQTVPPPGTAVLAPNAAVAPPYYGATTSPPLVSPPATSPTLAPPPVTPAAPPITTPYQYNMPPGYRPGPTGFSGVTPNVSMPDGQLVQPAAGAQPLVAAPPAGNRPLYGPPGGMAFPQAPAAQAAQQPTLAQQPPPGLLPLNSTADARDIRSATVGTPTVAAPAGWQAADNNRAADAESAASDLSSASISPNSSGAIRIVEPMRSVQPVSMAETPARAPTEFRPGNTSTLTPAGGGLNQTTTNAPIRDLADLPPVRTASFNAAPVASSAPATAGGSSSNYGYDAQYRWVKGKLEYSQSARTWRLRYIPSDAANDDFGGSVILADASNRLASFQDGEFVVAYGTLGQSGIDKSSFAAMYNVSQIQRQ